MLLPFGPSHHSDHSDADRNADLSFVHDYGSHQGCCPCSDCLNHFPMSFCFRKLGHLCSLKKSDLNLGKSVAQRHTFGFPYCSFLNNRRMTMCGGWCLLLGGAFTLSTVQENACAKKSIYTSCTLFKMEAAGSFSHAPPLPHSTFLLGSSRDSEEMQSFF